MKFKSMRPDSKQLSVVSRQTKHRKKSFSFLIRHPSSVRLGTLPIVIVLLLIGGYWAVLTFAPKPPAKPDATWTHILEIGALRVGIDPSFPPFESDDGKGHLKGFDIALVDEMLRDWSKANNTPIHAEYVYTGFDGVYDALKAGQFDAVVSALPYDPRRTEDVRFSSAYFDSGPYIVVRASDVTTQTHFDLAGKRIGIELGSTGDTFARRWQKRLKYDLHEFNSAAEALRALKQGQVDAVFTDLIAFSEFMRGASDLKTVGAPLVNEFLVIAVRKDAPTLLAQINAVIAAMKSDGRMEQLYKQWLASGG